MAEWKRYTKKEFLEWLVKDFVRPDEVPDEITITLPEGSKGIAVAAREGEGSPTYIIDGVPKECPSCKEVEKFHVRTFRMEDELTDAPDSFKCRCDACGYTLQAIEYGDPV